MDILYGLYLLVVISVFFYLSALVLYRTGDANRWLAMTCNFALAFFFFTWLFWGRLPIADRILRGLKHWVRSWLFHVGGIG